MVPFKIRHFILTEGVKTILEFDELTYETAL